jgi:hypothetical protein
MTPKCPFCTEEEFERKGCNHRLLSLKYTFPVDIFVDACKNLNLTDEEINNILTRKQMPISLCDGFMEFAYFNEIGFDSIDFSLDKITDDGIIDKFLFGFFEVYKDVENIIDIIISFVDVLGIVFKDKTKIEVIFDYKFSDDEENFLTIEKTYFYSDKTEIAKKLRDIIFVLYNIPTEISFFELSKLWYKEKNKGMIIFEAVKDEKTKEFYPLDKSKSDFSPESIILFSDFYKGLLNLLKKDSYLFFKLINTGKEIFSDYPKIIGKNIFTGKEKFEVHLFKKEDYIKEIDKVNGLVSTTRQLFEEIEEKFIFANFSKQENLKTKKEKLDKAVSLGILDEVMKNNVFYYWKLLSNYVHYSFSSAEDVVVDYLQRYDILRQSYVFLISKLIPYIYLKGLIK